MPVIAGAVLLAAAGFLLLFRSNDTGQLTIGPSPGPVDGATAAPTGSERLTLRSLAPLAVASEVPGAGPLFSGAPDLTLVVGQRERLAFVDMRTGDVRHVRLPRSMSPPPGIGAMFTVGSNVIVNHHDTVLRLSSARDRPVQVTEDRRAIPTYDDASMWVSDELTSAVASTAARVALDGTILERVRLPAVSRPVAGNADGLIVSSPGGPSVVDGNGADEIAPSGELIASNGRQVARLDCDAAVQCLIVVGTLDDPDQARTQLTEDSIPAGYFGLPSGAFSPDGRWVAVPLYRIDPTGALDRPVITVLEATTGAEAFRVEGPLTQAFSTLPLAWSPDSEWLFVASRDGITGWNATTGVAHPLTLDMEPPRALAVIE